MMHTSVSTQAGLMRSIFLLFIALMFICRTTNSLGQPQGEDASAAGAPELQFRPNLYFGFRDRKDPGLLLGLGWFKGAKSEELRYSCREQDQLQRWGFVKADAGYGKQEFTDGWLQLTTEHVLKGPNNNRVLVRISGSFINGTTETEQVRSTPVSLLVTLHSPSGVRLDNSPDSKGIRGDSISATTIGQQRRKLRISWGELENPHEADICTEHTERVRPGKSAPELTRTHFTAWKDKDLNLAFKGIDTIKPILKQSGHSAKDVARRLFRIIEPSDEASIHRRIAPILNNNIKVDSSNDVTTSVVFQRVLKVPFSVELTLSPESFEDNELDLKAELSKREEEFDSKFSTTFPILVTKESAPRIAMAKAALGNTIGSVGWFFGSNLLEDQTWSKPAGSLLSGVPSRSFFPRGFFWDEGFHQLLVSKFSPQISREVISSWLSRFDRNGWVAREQVLGLEAIERVPREFLAQNRTFANPPTLLLAVESLLDLEGEKNDGFFSQVFDTFRRHRDWLAKSQASRLAPGLMAWKGRSPDAVHTLTSGIDDYPRGMGGDFYMEAHVDLLSWACWEDTMMARIGERLGKPKETIESLRQSASERWQLIVKHHWNSKLRFFNDLGFLGEGTRPTHVPHLGYVGLMPFLLKLMPVTQKDHMEMLWDILKVLQNPQLLRAQGVGIRSLSKADKLFGEGENYWRGAVWINLNYMCVEALKHYAQQAQTVDASFSKLALGLARDIRNDLAKNIFERYRDEGFLFENYDSMTGKGRGTRPFTGWTALVVLLMNDEF